MMLTSIFSLNESYSLFVAFLLIKHSFPCFIYIYFRLLEILIAYKNYPQSGTSIPVIISMTSQIHSTQSAAAIKASSTHWM